MRPTRPRRPLRHTWTSSEAGRRGGSRRPGGRPSPCPGSRAQPGTLLGQNRTTVLDGDSNTIRNRPLAAGWAPGNRGLISFCPNTRPPGAGPGMWSGACAGPPRGVEEKAGGRPEAGNDLRSRRIPPAFTWRPGGAGSKGRAACPSSYHPGQPCPVRADGVTRFQEKLLAGSLHTVGLGSLPTAVATS